MAELMRVPEVAAGAAEVVVSEWLVNEGDRVRTGEAIAVIETDKANAEIEAEADAFLLRTLVAPGTTVEVGAPMALLGHENDASADAEALLQQLGVEPTSTDRTSAGAETAPPERRIFVSPLARKVARQAGVDLADVVGSGPHGRIRRRDVEAARARRSDDVGPAAPANSQPSPAAPAPSPRTEPHTPFRRAIARRLTESQQTVPHFYLRRSVVVDGLLELRRRINAAAETRVSINDMIVRAVAVASLRVPEFNVIWTDDSTRRFQTVDIAVAIDSPRGLVTPVLRAVDGMSLTQVSAGIASLVDLANAGRLQQTDLEGGSITVSNLGMYGVEEFSAIINPPHSSILAVGAAQEEPRVVDGTLTTASVMRLTLSVDHRVIDGALAARWLGVLVDLLEEPVRLFV